MIYLMGANGFVGSAFSRYFQEMGVAFTPLEMQNYTNYVGTKCDILINANGSSKKRLPEEDPKLDFTLNVNTVMSSLVDFSYKLYVLLSTIDVYNDVSCPENNHEAVIINPEKLSKYGFHKYQAELCVRKYACNWLIVRLGGMVGEGLKKNPVFDLLNNQTLWVHTESKYQYMNTQDVAKLVYHLISDEHKINIFNLCGDGVISPKGIQQLRGRPIKENNLPKEHYEINIDKIKALYTIPKTISTIREFVNQHKRS